jgi:hypothetical protein
MVPRVPASDRVIGELRAECDGACSGIRLRDALGVGAAYAGARHFGFPECRDSNDQPATDAVSMCRSWASAYQIDVAVSE